MLFKDRKEFKRKWIEDMKIKTTIDDEKYLSDVFEKNFINNDIELYNSASGNTIKKDGVSFIKDLDNYIIVENGAFYRQHKDGVTPLYGTITTNRGTRDYNKKLLWKAKSEKNYIAASMYDLKQKNVKTISNALYGTCINPYSKFYNYDIASSITIRGRSTVTVNSLTLEALLGSYRPYLLEVVLSNMDNIRKKDIPHVYMEYLTYSPTNQEILEHILKEHNDGYYGKLLLINRLNSYTEEERKKIYYSNNLEALLKLPYVIDKLNKTMEPQVQGYREIEKLIKEDVPKKETKYKEHIYLDPMKPCESIKDDMEELMDFFRKVLFGFYWYEGDITKYGDERKNTQEIFRYLERECIILNDTDSKIFYLGKGIDMLHNVPGIKEKMAHFSNQMRRETLGSYIIKITDDVIKDGLWRYTENSNVDEKYRPIIQYKQEFFFKTLQPTKGAKNYIGIITIQEGTYLPIPDIEIKGLPLKKSNFNKLFSKHAKEIVVNDIAKADVLDVSKILNKIRNVRKDLYEHYKTKDNLSIFTVSKLNENEDEISKSDHRYKAVKLFNHLFPEEIPIDIPGVFSITKIDLKDKEEDIENNYPKIYKRLLEYMKNESLRKTVSSWELKKEKILSENDNTLNEEAELFINGINNELLSDKEKINSYKKEWRRKLKTLPDNKQLSELIESLTHKKITLENVNKIALPIDKETVPEFITDHADTNEITVYDNLISAITEGIGLLSVRNNKKRNIVHNIVKYF